jgi:hypothetical protein
MGRTLINKVWKDLITKPFNEKKFIDNLFEILWENSWGDEHIL